MTNTVEPTEAATALAKVITMGIEALPLRPTDQATAEMSETEIERAEAVARYILAFMAVGEALAWALPNHGIDKTDIEDQCNNLKELLLNIHNVNQLENASDHESGHA